MHPENTVCTGENDGKLCFFNFLLANSPDQIYFKDRASRFICVSRGVAQRLGLSDPSAMIGKTDFDFFATVMATEAFNDEQRIIQTGESIIGKVEQEIHPDGTVTWAYTTKQPLRNNAGEIIGICGINKDFTAMKQMEEQLKKAQTQLFEIEKSQLAVRLAFGVAHEIRNPLNTLNMGIQYLADDPSLVKALGSPEILGILSKAVERAEVVVAKLMELSSPEELRLEKCDLHFLLQNTLRILNAELESAQIHRIISFQPNLPRLSIDKEKIEQVFMSLILNAIQAMPKSGTLTVRTLTAQLQPDTVQTDPGLRSGQRFRVGDVVMVVEIEDTGPGISCENMSRVFEPFFTTRNTGECTGLGLTVSQKIMELHNGTITLANVKSGGLKVTLSFRCDSE